MIVGLSKHIAIIVSGVYIGNMVSYLTRVFFFFKNVIVLHFILVMFVVLGSFCFAEALFSFYTDQIFFSLFFLYSVIMLSVSVRRIFLTF